MHCIPFILHHETSLYLFQVGLSNDSPQETMHVDIQVGRDAHLDVYIRSTSNVIDNNV